MGSANSTDRYHVSQSLASVKRLVSFALFLKCVIFVSLLKFESAKLRCYVGIPKLEMVSVANV